LPRRWARENDWPAATAIRVQQVAPGSPAATGGLKPGDWIIGEGGAPLAQLTDLLDRLAGEAAGRPLSLKILRPKAGVLETQYVLVTPVL
jgi:S1-C subfamily serine protease